MAEAWFTEAEAGRQLGVHERTLRRWREKGKVPFQRTPGGRIRYGASDMVAIIAGMMVANEVAAFAPTCPDTSGAREIDPS